MKPLKAFIVDDEYYVREVVKHFIAKYPDIIQLVGESDNVEQAYFHLLNEKPELVFLDITMENESGFDLLHRFFPVPFEVVFVTAHDHYALKALKMEVVDYILKPVQEQEWLEAVQKVIRKRENRSTRYTSGSRQTEADQEVKKMLVSNGNDYSAISFDDVLYLEADGNYTRIHFTTGSSQLVSRTIRQYESRLPDFLFFRIHRSVMVNLNHVKQIDKGRGGFVELSDGTHLPISYRRKEAFLSLFDDSKE
ncbi:MAG: response regulator [Bacteroidetes bacterium]|nr:response regulator [Bacteroidota bacterium]